MLNKYYLYSVNFSIFLLLVCIYFFVDSIVKWVLEVIEESFYGKYTLKLKTALSIGFLLFLISEIMLFGTFFWVYFDRLFHLTYVTGFLSVPFGVDRIQSTLEPLFATGVLVLSGYLCNKAFYLYRSKNAQDIKEAYLCSIMVNFLGFLFLYIQYTEYSHLANTITDTIYCNIFFTLTGFHGLHVLIGNLYLLLVFVLKFRYIDNNTWGLSLAVVYWHLVDIIWIFLIIFLYFFNNIEYLNFIVYLDKDFWIELK